MISNQFCFGHKYSSFLGLRTRKRRSIVDLLNVGIKVNKKNRFRHDPFKFAFGMRSQPLSDLKNVSWFHRATAAVVQTVCKAAGAAQRPFHTEKSFSSTAPSRSSLVFDRSGLRRRQAGQVQAFALDAETPFLFPGFINEMISVTSAPFHKASVPPPTGLTP
jgi:hypothetical protein